MEQRSVRGFQYEQVLPLHQLRIRRNSRLVLCSKSARVVPSLPTDQASGTPHRPAKHHHVALAQVPLRHPPRERRVRGIVDCSVPGITSRPPPRPRRLRMPRRPPIRITSRQPPRPRRPLKASRSGHPIIGAGKSDPSSKVTSNIRTKLRSLELLLRRRQRHSLGDRAGDDEKYQSRIAN